MKFEDDETGWLVFAEIEAPESVGKAGIVLKSVYHQGHKLASDVRIAGIRATLINDSDGSTESKLIEFSNSVPLHVLRSVKKIVPDAGGGLFNAVTTYLPTPAPHSQQSTFSYLREATEVHRFANYFSANSSFGLRADFETPPGFFGNNCLTGSLRVSQRFLFSGYSNQPAHEGTGDLNAARFHPILKIDSIANPTFSKRMGGTRIVELRVDYRVNLTLDQQIVDGLFPTLLQVSNQAALFRDRNEVALVEGFLAQSLQSPRSLSKAIFVAAEKPLKYEVIACGLIEGSDSTTTLVKKGGKSIETKEFCWDNLHWWGFRGMRGTKEAPLPSTPGAFHAAHLHWRWGKPAPSFLAEEHEGIEPLVPALDPKIPNQTLKIAVTRNTPKYSDPNPLCAPVFEELFEEDQKMPSQPSNIRKGEDLVLWYSSSISPKLFEVLRGSFGGSVFLHGLFFAHEPEPTKGLGLVQQGTTEPLHLPKEEKDIPKQWRRSPETDQ